MAANGVNNNNVVTLAKLDAKLDMVLALLERLEDHPARLAVVEAREKINCAEIEKLRTQTAAVGIWNTIAAIAAGVVGVKVQ